GLPFERQSVDVFVARPEELWRIPAWIALWETAFTDRQWTNASEAQTSLLLGYTAKQRAKWLADTYQRRATWTGVTVYTPLTADQKRGVIALGQRCLGDEQELSSMTLLYNTRSDSLRANAARLVPRELTMARVAVRP